MVLVLAALDFTTASLPTAPNLTLWRTNWNLTESHGFEFIDNYVHNCKANDPIKCFNLNQSYINLTGPLGLLGLDWTNSMGEWYHGATSTHCETVSRENCRRLKAEGMVQRCCIYHNTELALSWLESQRRVMDDPSKAGYFLQYMDGKGNKNGTIYAENIVFGRQWFWDHTNTDASDAFVAGILDSLDDPAVDCTFMDDPTGVPMEHPSVTGRIGMTPTQLDALQRATAMSYWKLFRALSKKGKWIFEQFQTVAFKEDPNSCFEFMEKYCEPAQQDVTMVFNAGVKPSTINQTVAAFLITRPPVAFASVKGPSMAWNPFTLQPGVPKGLCKKEGVGVYSREWTGGVARLDCSKWESELPFPFLDSD